MNSFELALIGGMALITFTIRYAFFAIGHRVRFNPLMARALSYVPVAVLSAIVAPAMLLSETGNLAIELDHAYLIGGIGAIMIAVRWGNLTATIGGGILCFFVWRWFYL